MGLFKQIQDRDDPHKCFMVFKNGESSTAWASGMPVCMLSNGTDDGQALVTLGTGGATRAGMVVGLADTATAAGEFGLVQVYGMRTDAITNQAGTASNANGAIGDVLIPWTAGDALSGAAAGAATAFQPNFVLMETVASSATVTTTNSKVFIRCM